MSIIHADRPVRDELRPAALLVVHLAPHPQASPDGRTLYVSDSHAPDPGDHDAAEAAWADREGASYADLIDRLHTAEEAGR